MGNKTLLSDLSDRDVDQSRTGLYLTIFLVATLIVVPLTVFVITRPSRLSPAAAPVAQLGLSPSSGTSVGVGQQLNVFVLLDTKGRTTDGVDVILNYDSSRLKFLSIRTDGPYGRYIGISNNACGSSISDMRGRITFSGLSYNENRLPTPPPHDPFKGSSTIATIIFEGVRTGSAAVGFEFTPGATNDSNVVETKTSQDILSSVTDVSYTIAASEGAPVPTPTPCPSTIPTGEPQPTLTPGGPVPTPPVVVCTAPDRDLDCDSFICASDANILLANWRKKSPPYVCNVEARPDCNPDFDKNGDVYGKEVSELMSNWSGQKCDSRLTPTSPVTSGPHPTGDPSEDPDADLDEI